MTKGKVRHMFPGGNTSLGFYSYYSNILPQDKATRIFILKGGPGVGKSTFMKKIGNEMLDRGYDVEYMHCSSDNNSLDGVVIPSIGVALVDGTAPHVVDPKNPGAVDEIIHLGDYWNEVGIRENREDVMKDNKTIGSLFTRAYRYLRAAAAVYEDTENIYGATLDRGRINGIAHELIDGLLGERKVSEIEGRQRCLFASAITPAGLQNYLDTVLTGRVIELSGNPGTGADIILEKVKEAAVDKGLSVECFYCALKPGKLEHLVIPEVEASITTRNKYHSIGNIPYRTINLDEYTDEETISKCSDMLRYNEDIFESLISRAVSTIKNAKEIHDRLESYYIPNMDFEAIQRRWESTMAKILKYADENRKYQFF